MAVPEGYTALGRLGYADKGNYAAGTTYMTGDVVYHNGSSYVARKDNMKGVTPVNGNDWKYLARGFAAETMADVQATDTSGVLGTAGAQVVSQSLIDAIADRVMTKLIGTNQIVNNLLATEPGSVLDATQGKALKEYYDRLNSDLDNVKMVEIIEFGFNEHVTANSINGTMVNGIVCISGTVVCDVSGTNLSLIGIQTLKARPKSNRVSFCGAFSSQNGDVLIKSNGEIVFNLPAAGAYAFSIAYNVI